MNPRATAWILTAALAGAGIRCGGGDRTEDDPPQAEGPARFALVRTDFESTAIAIMNAAGEVIHPSVLSSGSVAPGLVAALSGDVVVSDSLRGEAGVLSVLDRLGTDVLTRLNVDTAEVLGQLRLAPDAGDFSTNPHDLARVSGTEAWVSRFSVNLDRSVEPIALGNDVVEVDPTRLALTGRRIDLSAFDTTGIAMRDEGPVEVSVFARPSLLAVVGRTLVVGLALFSFEFDATASGRVALVDLDTLEARALTLPAAARNCGTVRIVPDASDLVLVACAGFGRPFGDPTQVRVSSGVYVLRVGSAEDTEIVSVWEPRAADRPLAVNEVVPLSANRFIGVAYGAVNGPGDQAFVVDIDAARERLLLSADEAFSIGVAALDPQTGRLVVPDRSRAGGGLRRYRRAGDDFEVEDTVAFTDGPLPPHAAYLLP